MIARQDKRIANGSWKPNACSIGAPKYINVISGKRQLRGRAQPLNNLLHLWTSLLEIYKMRLYPHAKRYKIGGAARYIALLGTINTWLHWATYKSRCIIQPMHTSQWSVRCGTVAHVTVGEIAYEFHVNEIAKIFETDGPMAKIKLWTSSTWEMKPAVSGRVPQRVTLSHQLAIAHVMWGNLIPVRWDRRRSSKY